VTTAVLVLAAGTGDRLGAGTPKALVSLRGRPLLEHALKAIAESDVADVVVVVFPEPARSSFESLLEDLPARIRATALVQGGQTRQESVRLGLEAVAGSADVVLCHDAARPLATAVLFRRVEEGLREVEGSIPMIPSPDTVKLVEAGKVIKTLPRAQVGLAQTPQAFLAPALLEAHSRALREGTVGTDDAMLVEAAGYSVAAVEGEIQNFKITTREDLRRAEQILSERGQGILR
jgi:2-C-methyl-D-erythritol 4-phosphate cytidylyltransferase